MCTHVHKKMICTHVPPNNDPIYVYNSNIQNIQMSTLPWCIDHLYTTTPTFAKLVRTFTCFKSVQKKLYPHVHNFDMIHMYPLRVINMYFFQHEHLPYKIKLHYFFQTLYCNRVHIFTCKNISKFKLAWPSNFKSKVI